MMPTQIGQFSITRKLGEGSMGAVYLATHRVLKSAFVVKVLHPQWSRDDNMVQRFFAEARAASAIEHPSIIEVFDAAQLSDGTCYIAMKYLDGGTLDRFFKSQGGPLSMHLVVQILATVASGLEAAHARDIVHCDLKPENIFLIRKGHNPHHSVILDFGVARMSEQLSGVRTMPGLIAGTPAYMAPEQIIDRSTVDRRSDVYALGVIAYQLATGGWLPFQQPDDPHAFFNLSIAAIREVQKTPPVDPRKRGVPISDRCAGAILAALQFDPARRPATPRAFLLMLAQATDGDAYQVNGTEIVRQYAPELLDTNNLAETLRGQRPSNASAAKRYRAGEMLGAGGMAEVYHGVVTGPGGFARRVAIKRIRAAFSQEPRFADMFVEEARLVAQLTHPNIVTMFDFDRDEEGRLFLALEFVDGIDLQRLMVAGPIPHPVVIFLLREMLAGLGHAHNLRNSGPMLGVVHRDISPHNVLLSWEGSVKVSDFGLAKPRQASEASASQEIRGKVGYLSPEQANGEALDGRSDLFAVGICAWEMLTGQSLFWCGDYAGTIARVLTWAIPKPSSYRPVPADLEAVVMKLLERDATARYKTAELAGEALDACDDAPKHGRVELARHLASQFPPACRQSLPPIPVGPPTESAPRSQPPTLVVTPAIPSPVTPTVIPWVPPPRLPEEASQSAGAAARHPTSVSMAASETMPLAVATRPRRGLAFGIAASAAIVTVVVTAVGLSMPVRAPRGGADEGRAPELVEPTRAPTAAVATPAPSQRIQADNTTADTLDAGVSAVSTTDASMLSAVHVTPDAATSPVPSKSSVLSGTQNSNAKLAPAAAPGHAAAVRQAPRHKSDDDDEVGGD